MQGIKDPHHLSRLGLFLQLASSEAQEAFLESIRTLLFLLLYYNILLNQIPRQRSALFIPQGLIRLSISSGFEFDKTSGSMQSVIPDSCPTRLRFSRVR
jgi:hypothetical protein